MSAHIPIGVAFSTACKLALLDFPEAIEDKLLGK